MEISPLIAVYRDGKLIGEFNRYIEACTLTNISYRTLIRFLNSGKQTVEGYTFKRPESYRPRSTRITWYLLTGNACEKYIRGYDNLKEYLGITSDQLTNILKTDRLCPDGRYIVKINNLYEVECLEKMIGGNHGKL